MLALAFVVALAAQQPAPAASPSPSAPAPATDYVIGPGDVLEISVFENPDLSRTTTVQTNGAVALSLLGDVQVGGLTIVEVQRKLEALLERDFLVNPQVEVKIREYQSQFVIVLGEVNTPGRKVLRGRTRLIDILIDAGGLKPTASGEVTITRTLGTFDGGKDTLRLQIGSAGMTPVDRINLEIPLRNGDLLNVLPRNHVTVEGEVGRPGRYAIDAGTTLSAVILEAGGLGRFGSNDVKVRRIDPQTGKAAMLELDLKAIRNGKKPDLPLMPNDVVIVARRRF